MKIVRINLPDPALRISIRSGQMAYLIPLGDIIYCCAKGNYSCFHLVNGEKHLSYRNLSSVREELVPHGFFLIHKSYLVNTIHIRGFSVNGHSKVILTGNIKLGISRRRKVLLQEMLKTATGNR